MPSTCSVPNCRGNYRNGPKVRVYSYPQDNDFKRKWITCMGRENFQPSKYSKVCELHFKESDFMVSTEFFDEKTGRLIVAPLKIRRLRPDAVPSKFPNKIHAQSAPSNVLEQPESRLPDESDVPNLDIVKKEPIEHAEGNLHPTSNDFLAVQCVTNFTLSLKSEPNDDCVDGMKILVHPDNNVESSFTSHTCADNEELASKRPNISSNPFTNNTETEDEFHVFGDFVATKLRSLTDRRLQVEAQHRIMNMLFEMEMEDFSEDSLPVISSISSLQKPLSMTVTLSPSSNISRNPSLQQLPVVMVQSPNLAISDISSL